MSRPGRPDEKFSSDVLVGARFFLGRVVAVRLVGTCLLPHERFYCATPFRSSRASVGAFRFPFIFLMPPLLVILLSFLMVLLISLVFSSLVFSS